MCDDLPGVVVGLLYHRLGDADLGLGQQSGEPLAVYVDTVPDDDSGRKGDDGRSPAMLEINSNFEEVRT